MAEAQKRLEASPPIEEYYEKFKQDKGEMFLQKGPYASEEEARAAFNLFAEKVWAIRTNGSGIFSALGRKPEKDTGSIYSGRFRK